MRDIKAEWWMDDDSVPYVVINIEGEEAELERDEAYHLQERINACLNGIIYELALYLEISGWGVKHHLAVKEGFTKTTSAICGMKPHKLHDGSLWEWNSWPLQGEPNDHEMCLNCRSKYDQLERRRAAPPAPGAEGNERGGE